MPAILLGTSVSGRAEAAARERPAQESLATLTAAGVAHAVNLAFHDESPGASRLDQLCVLRMDARLVSRAAGPRKPIVTEMLDVLAAEAERRGIFRDRPRQRRHRRHRGRDRAGHGHAAPGARNIQDRHRPWWAGIRAAAWRRHVHVRRRLLAPRTAPLPRLCARRAGMGQRLRRRRRLPRRGVAQSRAADSS